MLSKKVILILLAISPLLGSATEVEQRSPQVSEDSRADLRNLTIFVGVKFKKSFVLDPRVQGTVDLGSFTADTLSYHAFLELLGVHGFVAMPSGDVISVLPNVLARTKASPIVHYDSIDADDSEVITVVIPTGDGDPVKLAIMLRPLVAMWGYISVTTDQHSLLLVDTAENAKRIVGLVSVQTKGR